jgi:putative ABC transport system permease protein
MTSTPQPPRFARWLLRRALDGPVRSAIIGDLDEEFSCILVERFGLRAARRWYWRQTLLSIAACLREPSAHRISLRSAIMQDSRGLGTDFRAALRFCWRHPLLSAIVVSTLAVGVGVNAAAFSVLNATYFKKLPIAHADRFVSIGAKDGGLFTYPEYLALRDLPGIETLIAGGRTSTTLDSTIDDARTRQRIVIEMVTANYFSALGVGPGTQGRLFDAADGESGKPPVVVLSDTAWRERFGSDPSAIGRTVRLRHAIFTIVGVAPAGFTGTQIGYSPDLWVPLTQAPLIDGNTAMLGPAAGWLGLGGVLERIESLATVTAALNARWKADGRDDIAVVRLTPRGRQWYTPAPESRLRLIGVFSLLTLAIACLNVSTLIGTTVQARQKELAIRSSLGAGRLRLLRQLLAEHMFLAALGGVGGGLLGTWMARGLAPLMASRFTPGDLDVSPDVNVALFTFGVAFVAAAAIGVMPAVRWSRVNTLPALQGHTAGLTRLFGSNGLWWLIPWQAAFGTVLLASAGLLGKTVQQLKLGIQASAPERVWFANVTFDTTNTPSARMADVRERLRLHLASAPAIEAVALSSGRPLSSISRGPLRVEGMTTIPDSKPMPWGPPPPPPPRGGPHGGPGGGAARLEKPWIVSQNYVTPGYFAALALPMRVGRDFTPADDASAPGVAIVNETLATRAFGNANPIGRRVSFGPPGPFDIEVIGVVRDLRYEHLREAAPDGIFFPLAQVPKPLDESRNVAGATQPLNLTLILRARPDERMSRDRLQQAALDFDPSLFIDRISTFDEEANGALSQERVLAGIGWSLGITALVLLVVGLYGTMAAAVIRSRRELGIRLALGARPRSLRFLVVGRCLMAAALGLAIGLPLAYAATKSFAHLLYGVRPMDPIVAAATVAMIVFTAAVAGLVPARRAACVDPVVALRTE